MMCDDINFNDRRSSRDGASKEVRPRLSCSSESERVGLEMLSFAGALKGGCSDGEFRQEAQRNNLRSLRLTAPERALRVRVRSWSDPFRPADDFGRDSAISASSAASSDEEKGASSKRRSFEKRSPPRQALTQDAAAPVSTPADPGSFRKGLSGDPSEGDDGSLPRLGAMLRRRRASANLLEGVTSSSVEVRSTASSCHHPPASLAPCLSGERLNAGGLVPALC